MASRLARRFLAAAPPGGLVGVLFRAPLSADGRDVLSIRPWDVALRLRVWGVSVRFPSADLQSFQVFRRPLGPCGPTPSAKLCCRICRCITLSGHWWSGADCLIFAMTSQPSCVCRFFGSGPFSSKQALSQRAQPAETTSLCRASRGVSVPQGSCQANSTAKTELETSRTVPTSSAAVRGNVLPSCRSLCALAEAVRTGSENIEKGWSAFSGTVS